MNQLILNGSRVSYADKGSGSIILFVHGWNGSGYLWHMNLEGLSGSFRPIALDLPGHGDSELPPDFSFTMEGYSAFIEQFCDALHLTDITLAGHSFGGSIAMYYAVHHPGKASRLVLIDSPSTSKVLPWPLRLPFLKRLLAVYQPLRGRRSYRRMLTSSVQHPENLPADWLEGAVTQASKVDKTALIRTTMLIRNMDLEDELARIDLPVLVLWGDNDCSVKLDEAYHLQDSLADVRLEILPDCNHCPPYEYPDLVNTLITGFIEETS
jgi:pimeloyl-ACP methyl ester carboxylesterase